MNALGPALPLVDRCIAGDERAWRELHRDFRPYALRFLRRLGVPEREADDLCQNVFVQVFRYLARFEGRADFRTWLYKLCVSQARRYRREKSWPLLGWLSRPRETAVSIDWSSEEMASRAERALARLKPAHRDAFVLFELEGLSGQEIAEVLGCRITTVWTHVWAARREFAAWLREGPIEKRSER